MEKLSHELGRYKKKVADQAKIIKELQETIAGYEQREDVNLAMIAAVVEQVGNVTIGRDRITEIIRERVHVIADYDADKRTYALRMMGGDKDEKEGSPSC